MVQSCHLAQGHSKPVQSVPPYKDPWEKSQQALGGTKGRKPNDLPSRTAHGSLDRNTKLNSPGDSRACSQNKHGSLMDS